MTDVLPTQSNSFTQGVLKTNTALIHSRLNKVGYKSLVKAAPSTYFRSLLTTNKKYRYEQEIKISFVTTIYAYLTEYVTFPHVNLPDVCDTDNIEDIAIKLRECWNLGYGPIDNLIFYAEKNGIILTSVETSTNDIDAFSQKIYINDEERYIVALSKNKSTAARLHFDVAHELGHIMLHDWEEYFTLRISRQRTAGQ